jgi:hypothetical protein
MSVVDNNNNTTTPTASAFRPTLLMSAAYKHAERQ